MIRWAFNFIGLYSCSSFSHSQAYHEHLGKPLVLILIPDGHDRAHTIDYNPLLETVDVRKVLNSESLRSLLSMLMIFKVKNLEDKLAAVSKVVKELKTTKASKDAVKKAEDEQDQVKAILALVHEAVRLLKENKVHSHLIIEW